MIHTLVIPNELEQKLIAAHANTATHNKWLAIGVDTVDDMKTRIKDRINEKNPKLEVTSIRIEDKTTIKERIPVQLARVHFMRPPASPSIRYKFMLFPCVAIKAPPP